jgi:PAS domain S-box-containing protein
VPADADADGHRQWVEAWRAAVRESASAVGLVELPSTRFLELSEGAAERLGTTPAEAIGLDYLAVVERPHEAELSIGLVTMGAVDAVHARRRFRRPDGSVVELPTCGRAIRSRDGTDLGLWVIGDPATEQSARLEDVMVEREGAEAPELGDRSSAVASLDRGWRVAQLDTHLQEILGYRPAALVGRSLTDLVHPEDVAVLLLTFARATSEGKAEAGIRVRHRDGTWRTVAAVATAREDDGPPLFSLALRETGASFSGNGGRVTKLEHHLRRIATEVRAAGVMVTPTEADDLGQIRTISGLSARQDEVLSRLMRGERVPRIAEAMYLSQSTVRNHLTAIFRKAGVRSQEGLLAHLRGTPRVDPPRRA